MLSKIIFRPYLIRPIYNHLTKFSTKTFPRSLSSLPIAIKVSPREVASNNLTWQNLELATKALHRDGLVVLEDVLDHAKLDRLNKKMNEDAQTLQSKGDASPFNYNKGYFLCAWPKTSTLVCFGKQCLATYTRLPPQSQPVHSDADFEHPSCPFALVVNVPLVEMTPKNGSTEVWLGTHHLSSLAAQEGQHGERASGRIKLDFLEKRSQERPPAQPVVRKGSLVIRDLRLWHAGKPNFTDETRVMLAMIHFAPWFRNAMQVEYSEKLKQTLENHEDTSRIQSIFFPDAEIVDRYLDRGFGNAYNFDQDDDLSVVI